MILITGQWFLVGLFSAGTIILVLWHITGFLQELIHAAREDFLDIFRRIRYG